MAIDKEGKVKWESKKEKYLLACRHTGTSIIGNTYVCSHFRGVIVGTGDIITMQLNLSSRKVKFSFKDKEHELSLSSDICDDNLRYYLVCRVGVSGDLGHKMRLMDFHWTELND